MRDFCNSCEESKTCKFVNGVSECACDEKVYFEEGYNQALEDVREKLLDTISHKYNYPYFDDAIYGLVNDALVDSVNELKR